MYESKIVRDYRDGKVTKEQLEPPGSTCDQNAKVNDGLSAASRAQLAHQTGEEIVDADIARQTVEQQATIEYTLCEYSIASRTNNRMHALRDSC